MSSEHPRNLIFSDEAIAEYQSWLEEIKERRTGARDKVAPLSSRTRCALLDQDNCVKELNCARCPAAQETFRWAEDKMRKDGIVGSGGSSGPTYEAYPGLGSIKMMKEINIYPLRAIHFKVEGYDQRGMVTIFTS